MNNDAFWVEEFYRASAGLLMGLAGPEPSLEEQLDHLLEQCEVTSGPIFSLANPKAVYTLEGFGMPFKQLKYDGFPH
ncbi:MAG: hypothetical protein A2508_01700 [Candidatus Lambdaproteobacteria bacterium RIFOXYD12_FULL_49_8]|nr:MAG: hypothetical protein A2508_01700 [Candidatus Lambdaproteobacteria bacterium RIFOXYD12_FULL_49_8]